MDFTRRDFIKWSGIAGLSVSLSPALKAFELLSPDEAYAYFLPDEYKYSMCGTCDSNCGVIFHMKGGVIREIQGNPADELGGRGDLCVKGQSAMRNIYDPDLLKCPMKRTNPSKGVNEDPGWVAISWDEAFTMIADKMAAAIDEIGPRSILVMARPKPEDMHFVLAVGTPNQTCHVDTCYINHEGTWKGVLGTSKSRTMETEKSDYLLCFGYDMPGKSKMAQLKCFLEAKANGAKVVAFDPRLCITANMADEWWPIKPGTDLAVALAMIHVILNESRYNAAYVAANVNPGDITLLTDHVNAEGYTPAWAESISEIPATDIERIAREFAGADHPIIPTYKRDAGGPVYANSASFGQAQMILNALVGAIEGTGGHLFTRGTSTPPGFTHNPYPARDGTIRVDGQHKFPLINGMFSGGKKSKGNMSHLAEGLGRARLGLPYPDEEPSYPVKVIISHKYNPTTIPQMDHFISEICQPDIFMAAIDSIPNSMCWFADVILPEPWWAEGKGFGTTSQHCLWPRLYLKDGIGALFSRKGGGSIYNGILEKLLPQLPTPLPYDYYSIDWGGLKNARMAQFAVDHGMGTTTDDFKNWLNANNGIWQDKAPITPKSLTTLGTPSGKIELYSQHFANKGHEPMPTWHPKLAEPAAEDEFYLITHHNPYNRMYKNCNDPLISDLQPENLLHMHPDAAGPYGLETGDYVRVKNPVIGKELVIKVKVTKGIRPDTMMTEHGFGVVSKNLSVACGKGSFDGDLMPDRQLADSLTRYGWNPSMSSNIIDTIVKIVGKEPDYEPPACTHSPLPACP